jgi:tetratricopeptide (TPR) repeat protein
LLAQAYNNAGIAFDDEGKYGDAERLFRQALSTREQLFGADSPEAAQSFDNLGNTLYHEGRYADALQMHTRGDCAGKEPRRK